MTNDEKVGKQGVNNYPISWCRGLMSRIGVALSNFVPPFEK